MDKTDILLPMSRTTTDDYMAQIVTRTKTHEFRKRRYLETVVRVWFYETAPVSAVTYICEAELASTRPPVSDSSSTWHIPETGTGNAEFNNYHPDWDGYDYAYIIKSCRRLWKPITLRELKDAYAMKSAPRGMVYLPNKIQEAVAWEEQEWLW